MRWGSLGPILTAIFGLFALPGSVTPSQAQESVDFVRDIEPILSKHCWKCHGEMKAEGGLRLDQRQFAERGGGSGKNLLNLAREENELLRRVRSTVDGERMPIEGPPLSAAQIASLERWISQGAPWPDRPKLKPKETNQQAYQAGDRTSFDQLLDRWEYVASARYRPVYITMIGFLVVLLVIERVKKAKATRPAPKGSWLLRHTARISRAWYLVGMLVLVCFWLVQFARDQAAQSRARSVVSYRAGNNNSHIEQRQLQGMNDPFRPQHPPRLGGAYYRGNDERSEELFNGGFYRTATFHVHLADAEGHDLAWGDPVPDKPHIRFEIIRSPHASPTLFVPEIMDHVGLSPVQPERRATATEMPFSLLKADAPGERWSILYPLEPFPGQGRLTGKLYVYKGNSADSTHRSAEASYLIGYELRAEEGKISRQSQIWMASVYNVSSLQWPEPGQIPADQWFDFRPIPEIEPEIEPKIEPKIEPEIKPGIDQPAK